MPNWCYNHIEVKGKPNDIKKISNIIENLKKEKNDMLFQSLIGLPEGIDIEKYNDDWYDINVNWFGAKWDVGIDFVEEIEEDYILFSGYTAWSPPTNFCIELSKRYNVQVEMYFEESGFDYCGKSWIDSEGGCSEELYAYQEGIYRFEGFQDWYEREWELMSDWLVDELYEEEGFPDFQRTITDKLPFLNDEEVDELSIELKSLVETSAISSL
jgi:hypothetical protein